MTSVAGPSQPPQYGGSSSKPSGKGRYQANMKKYGTPLPILLPSSPLHPNYKPPSSASSKSSYLTSFSSVFEPAARVETPTCTGTFDPTTRSVWVTNRKDVEIIFNRGFFGKGTLSRSEPTWRSRRIDQVKGGENAAAEKIREKRRQERKQFKIDRAEAILSAARTAEAVLVTGQMPEERLQDDQEKPNPVEGEEEAEGSVDDASSTAPTTNIDLNSLTPQTFLVRPTRPDANRNRGKKAFKRRPPQPPPQAQDTQPQASTSANTLGATVPESTAAQASQAQLDIEGEDESASDDEFDEEVIEEMEHLQLGLEEAWFLSAGIGVLKILDPQTDTYLSPGSVLPLLQTPTDPAMKQRTSIPLRSDDPFLVSYACYHHFRSLGWIVKPGMKFSSDWILYKKGPVFSHAAFSCVMIPVYADEKDRQASPYKHTDWYAETTDWKWMNTIMRVNSLVQKTVILVYITIPAMSEFSPNVKLADGSLDPRKNDMRSLIDRYHIKESSLARFSPARRRD